MKKIRMDDVEGLKDEFLWIWICFLILAVVISIIFVMLVRRGSL